MKHPSFKAQHGRKPMPNIDYDPDDCWCQDDYEYFTGTGRYSDDALSEYLADMKEEEQLKSLRYGF